MAGQGGTLPSSGSRPPLTKNSASDPRPLVLLLGPLYPPYESALSESFNFVKAPNRDPSVPLHAYLAAQASCIRALLTDLPVPVDAPTLDCLPRLECVVACTAGVEHVDLAECRRRGIVVANAGKALAEDAAEYAVGMIIDVLRRVSAADRYVRQGKWIGRGDYPLGSKLDSKRVGIVGLGNIGSAVAKRLQPFGCIVSYTSRRPKPWAPYTYFPDTHDLALHSDVLVLTCALTAETHHVVDKDVLTALGGGGFLVNLGRGALVDEVELVRCLADGRVAGAALDVFENEPTVPPEMGAMDNVVLSPHAAVLTHEAIQALLQLVEENLHRFFEGKLLLSVVESE